MPENLIKDKVYAVALSVMNEQASSGLWKFMKEEETAESLADKIFGRREAVTQQFIAKKYSLDVMKAAEEILHESACRNISLLSYWDNDYPQLLREISRPPLVLYHIGEVSCKKNIAIVGTRKPDKNGQEMAEKIARDLAGENCTVVSGMASGIDRAAHQGALHGGGRTIGVMANGLDIMYPTRNRDIYQQILGVNDSSLVSEYPPGVYGGKFTFVRRNRIISGLSSGTLVVQAPVRSGALITADYSLNQNREVFACCSYSFNEEYLGCHRLIQKGALLVTGAADILHELGWLPEETDVSLKKTITFEEEVMLPLDPDKSGEKGLRGKILQELKSGDLDMDTLLRKLQVSPGSFRKRFCIWNLTGC